MNTRKSFKIYYLLLAEGATEFNLFDTTPQNITQHLKNLYNEKEIEQGATCKDFLQVQSEGERNIERIIKGRQILYIL